MVTDETAGRNLPAWAAEDHACSRCSLAYAQITVDDALQAIQALPAQLRAAVDAVPPRFRRQRPDPSTWSVAEYACHLRDVLISTTIRLHRGRTENAPAVDPMFNDLRADRFGYNQANLTAVLDETVAAMAGLCAEVSRMSGPDWERVVLRQPGEQRTSRWLVRQAMHEGRHHLDDIAAVHASLTRRQRDLPGQRPVAGASTASRHSAPVPALLQPRLTRPRWRRGRPDGPERLVFPADAPQPRRQRPQRQCPPQL
jgi:hypothetical protein